MARLFTPSESKYYLMALDADTGSIRAVIFDLEGNQIAVGQAEWRHLAVPDVPGSMEFDLNKNWQLACECMRQALHNAGIAPEYIAAVSALFYITMKGHLSGPAPMWMPERRAKLANLKNCTTIPLKTKFIARPDKHWL